MGVERARVHYSIGEMKERRKGRRKGKEERKLYMNLEK